MAEAAVGEETEADEEETAADEEVAEAAEEGKVSLMILSLESWGVGVHFLNFQ